MSFYATAVRGGTYEPHPIPRAARLHAHVASFFHAEGDRTFAPKATGREIAEELARNLRPSARRALLKEDA